MKTGKSLVELATELERQNNAKRDFIADTRVLQFTTEQHTEGEGKDQKITGGASVIGIPHNGGSLAQFTVTDHTHSQIAERLKIPKAYYDRMRSNAPQLLDNSVHTWFQVNAEKRMVRCLDDHARAFLSDRYRPLDNHQLATAVLPIIADITGMRIESCDLTASKMYLKCINTRLQGEIKTGDVVQGGIIISNSEIGLGSLRVEPLIYRLVCSNGMIAADSSLKKYHVGRAADQGDAAFELFRDETLKADDQAFFLKVQDVVRACVDQVKFNLVLDRYRQTTTQMITGDVPAAVEVTATQFGFNALEKSSVLTHLIQGGDLSLYGLANAVTRASQDLTDYDRATDFEYIGGEIIELTGRDWQQIAEAKPGDGQLRNNRKS